MLTRTTNGRQQGKRTLCHFQPYYLQTAIEFHWSQPIFINLCQGEGRRGGNGSMTWTYGASYQGEWIAGDRHGSGRYTLPAAEILESELATEAEFLLSAPGLNQDHPGADDDLEFDDDDSRLIKYHTRLFVLKTDGNTTGEGEH